MTRAACMKLCAKAIREAIAKSKRPSTGELATAFYRVGYLDSVLERLAEVCDEGDVDMLARMARPALKVGQPIGGEA